jgi:hypothetical protein
MPNWPQLTPQEQNDLLGEITLMLVEALPAGWQQLMIDYSVVGRTLDAGIGVKDASGQFRHWEPPTEVWRLFARLRKGMYQQDVGVWFGCRLTIDPPSRYHIQYNREVEPRFPTPPSPDDFLLEEKRYPRKREAMPEWYARNLEAAQAAATGPA